MAQVFLDMLYSLGSCVNCFPGSPTLKINSRSFKILRLLGEGGFSYVYLVSDMSSNELFALKKIRCPFGAESVAQAMKEVEAYRLFARAPGIIHAVDHAVAGERSDPASKTVYVLLPYYRRGNLQDMINANLVNHTRFPEKHLMLLFLGVCRALREMHHFRGGGAGGAGGERMEMRVDGVDENVAPARRGTKKRSGKRREQTGADVDDEAEQQQPLMLEEDGLPAAGEVRSYAHRDIKPGNIMISDSGAEPILMDLGSVAASPLAITSRSLAIATQDTAAEHSTMPYRAPELFDVKTGTVIDTKVDIWSLGCTLYACLVGKSPFEARSDETGGSLSICVLSGDWRFPDERAPGVPRTNTASSARKGKAPAADGAAAATTTGGDGGGISEPIREVVRRCLRVEPSERPDIDELIELVERVVEELPEDGSA